MMSGPRLALALVLIVCGCAGRVGGPSGNAGERSPAALGGYGGTIAGQEGGATSGHDSGTTSAHDAGTTSMGGGRGPAEVRDAGMPDSDSGPPQDAGRGGGRGPVTLTDGVFLETFDTVAPITSRNGPLPVERFSVSRWRQSWFPAGNPETRGYGPELPGDIRISDGKLIVECGMQEYGDTLVRINQPFEGDRIEVDAQLVQLEGESELLLTDRPYTSPSFYGENGEGPHMDNGFGFYWKANGCPMLRRWIDGVQTEHFGDGSSSPGPYTCLGPMPKIGKGVLNHVVIQLSSSEITVSIDGSLVGHYPASPISFGYVMIGTHNHATDKYSHVPTNDSIWDNLTWNGGAPLASSRVAQVANAGGRFFGWPLPASEAAALTTSALSLRGATKGWLLVDVGTYTPAVPEGAVLQFRLNDGAMREAGWQYKNRPPGEVLATTFSIPVELSELVEGPNSVRLFSSSLSSLSPFYANVDIVVR